MDSLVYSESKSKLFRAASSRGHLETVIELSNDAEVDINWKGPQNWTALHSACRQNRLQIVQFLLGLHGTDPNPRSFRGRTPFHFACMNGHDELVSFLLDDQRIDINKTDVLNMTALWMAARYGRFSVVGMILASWRIIHTKEVSIHNGTTAAQEARLCKHISVADLLESFENNPMQVRMELRKKLGFQVQDVGKLFALVVYFSDGFLQPKEKGGQINETRFFSVASRLPIELQMILCHRVFGSSGTIVKTKHSEPAFKEYANE